MLVIDSNQVKIIELETEIQHLQVQQEKVTAELRVKFTPKKIVHTLNKCWMLLNRLEKTNCFLLNWRRKLERKEKQLKRSYKKSCKKSKSKSKSKK
jgi:hypothetical protein